MRKFLPFIFIIMMLVIMLGFSAQSGTDSNSLSRFISQRLESFLDQQGNNSYSANEINFILRKLAHFTEYLVFAVLLVCGINNLVKSIFPSVILSGIVGGGVALFDEKFQQIAIDRTSSLFDVVIDGLGIGVGLSAVLIFVLLSHTREKELRQSPVRQSLERESPVRG